MLLSISSTLAWKFIRVICVSGSMLQLGDRSSDGSFVIVAPFAGSPAEEVSDAPLSLHV